MSDVVASISRLVESARRLRAAADDLGQIDLKSQIVDEISTLQEIRDEMSSSSPVIDNNRSTDQVSEGNSPSSASIPVLKADDGPGIVEPTGQEETYSISAEEDVENVVSEDTDSPGDDDPSNVDDNAAREERRALIEMRISELEQLEQAATRRLNDVPTPEQKKIKARANHEGREAGKTGKELQHFVISAMKLTPEQRTELQAARKDVHSLRDAIAKEQETLASLAAPEA